MDCQILDFTLKYQTPRSASSFISDNVKPDNSLASSSPAVSLTVDISLGIKLIAVSAKSMLAGFGG